MEILKAIRKIGKLAAAVFGTVIVSTTLAMAESVEFRATVDSTQVSTDDSVSLKLAIKTEGATAIGSPRFNAPDFEVINQYNSTFVESYYDNGRFGMRNTREITQVLKPLRTGNLKIGGIQVEVGGKAYRASDILVKVGPPGAGTPPPKGYGGSGVGLRGAGKKVGRNILIRAEVDKDKIYKGEQVIVSYYLYRRVRVFNIQVNKYPVLNGFLREDLEMPILGQRLDSERVVLDGAPYERSLLVRYAAYPLQEGKLKIDSIGLKYNYYANRGNGNSGLDDDPFMQFFQQLAPQTGDGKSEQISLEVLPLPEEGRPASFTGGVGEFNVTSAVNKYEVHANEAITLTVKVEGRGNLAAISEPKAKWPNEVEFYDSKGVAKSGKGGVGQKVFEFLLIPRSPGKLALPALEFSFFDPAKKAYVTRTTEAIELNVSDPLPGSDSGGPARRTRPAPAASSASNPQDDLRGLKVKESKPLAISGHPLWRWLYWGAIAVFGLLVLIVGRDLVTRSKKIGRDPAKNTSSKSWDRMKSRAGAASNGVSWNEVIQSYELLTGLILDALEEVSPVGARSLPRSELKQIYVDEKGITPEVWDRLEKVLEFAETVRFASSAGAVSEDSARRDLQKWVSEGEALVRLLGRSSS